MEQRKLSPRAKKWIKICGYVELVCSAVGMIYVLSRPNAKPFDVLATIMFFGVGIYMLWLVGEINLQRPE